MDAVGALESVLQGSSDDDMSDTDVHDEKHSDSETDPEMGGDDDPPCDDDDDDDDTYEPDEELEKGNGLTLSKKVPSPSHEMSMDSTQVLKNTQTNVASIVVKYATKKISRPFPAKDVLVVKGPNIAKVNADKLSPKDWTVVCVNGEVIHGTQTQKGEQMIVTQLSVQDEQGCIRRGKWYTLLGAWCQSPM